MPEARTRKSENAAEFLPGRRGLLTARHALGVVLVLYLLVVLPVVVRGAPLADDFHTCMRPVLDGSFGPFLADSWRELGAVRPARFLEIAAIGGLCQRVPFGVLVAIPLLLKLVVAWLLLGLVRDLVGQGPWPYAAVGIWLLEPLGTEAALWPSALHIPLGLALALASLRLYRRGHFVLGTLAAAAACLSVEQVIFALPLAVWLTAGEHRRRATAAAGGLFLVVLVAYMTWSGQDFRTDVPLVQRITAVFEDPKYYVLFPAVGLGLHSGALALAWAFPLSLLVVLAGAAVGAIGVSSSYGRRAGASLREVLRPQQVLPVLALVALVNLPLVVSVPRGYSARTFTPTWLLLSVLVAVVAARVAWRPGRLAAGLCGAMAALALLSIALSTTVRLTTADFTERSSRYLAAQVPDGGTVEICNVPRTVVSPAPLGAFHLHELHWTWASRQAVAYYTDRRVTISRTGQYWPGECPSTPPADLTLDFRELRRAVE